MENEPLHKPPKPDPDEADATGSQPEGDRLSRCEQERVEYLEGWKRAKADLINYKKDEVERLSTLVRFGNEALMRDLISVFDSFTIGINSFQGDETARRGMQLIRSQLEDVLRQYGVEKVRVTAGDRFDPSRHEAIGTIESDRPPDTVVEEVEAGYSLHERIIRPARVIVSKGQVQTP